MTVIRISCTCCKGTGKVVFTGVFAETFRGAERYLKRHPYLVANRAAPLFGCQPTALSNRLKRLETMGLLKAERYGKQVRYTLP